MVLKVLSDILLAPHAGDLAMLILLNLSAAFDSVDHDMLLRRLRETYGVVMNWFASYLSGRLQHVRVSESSFSPSVLLCFMEYHGVGSRTDPLPTLHR